VRVCALLGICSHFLGLPVAAHVLQVGKVAKPRGELSTKLQAVQAQKPVNTEAETATTAAAVHRVTDERG
jgi:hypothetical protein